MGEKRAREEQAHNGRLELATYMASPDAAGTQTRFPIIRLPGSTRVFVLRSGTPYEDWTRLIPDAVEVETSVTWSRFSISKGLFCSIGLPIRLTPDHFSIPTKQTANSSILRIKRFR